MAAMRFIMNPGRTSKQGQQINVGKENAEYEAIVNTVTMHPDDMKAMGVTDIRDFFDRDTAIETVFGLLKPLFEKLKKHSIDKLCGELEKRCRETGGVMDVQECSADPQIDKVKPEPADNCNHFEIAEPKGPVYKRVCDFLRTPAQSDWPWRPRPA